jgi:hypothetical protein
MDGAFISLCSGCWVKFMKFHSVFSFRHQSDLNCENVLKSFISLSLSSSLSLSLFGESEWGDVKRNAFKEQMRAWWIGALSIDSDCMYNPYDSRTVTDPPPLLSFSLSLHLHSVFESVWVCACAMYRPWQRKKRNSSLLWSVIVGQLNRPPFSHSHSTAHLSHFTPREYQCGSCVFLSVWKRWWKWG